MLTALTLMFFIICRAVLLLNIGISWQWVAIARGSRVNYELDVRQAQGGSVGAHTVKRVEPS